MDQYPDEYDDLVAGFDFDAVDTLPENWYEPYIT